MARPDFSSQAGVLPIEVEAGATHIEAIQWLSGISPEPVDLIGPGCTARLAVRQVKNAGPALIEITEGNGITLGADGNITLEFTPAQTLSLAQDELVNVFYDLEVSFVTGDDAGRVKRVIEGPLHIDWSASSV